MPHTLLRSLTAAALAATVLALAACGGEDSSGLNRDDLTAQANDICKKIETQGKKIAEPTDITDASQAAAYFDEAAPLIQQQVDELSALEPDDEVKADYDAFMVQQNAANELVQTIRKKADAADPSGMEDLAKMDPLGAKVESSAKKLGATDCA